MHSLHGQNVFLTSCGLKSRIIQDCSINRSCEDVRLETVLPDEYPKVFFFLLFSGRVFGLLLGVLKIEFVPGQKTVQVHP